MENIGVIKKKTFRFSTPDKTVHFFELEFEDGTTGIGHDRRSDGGSWVVGEEVLYDIEPTTWSKSGKPYNKITKRSVTKPKENAQALAAKGSWNDPLTNTITAQSVGRHNAILYFKKCKYHAGRPEIQRAAEAFDKWVLAKGTDRNVVGWRWNHITDAIEMMDLDGYLSEPHIASVDEIIDRAEWLWNSINRI